jgi:hypothetical protein
VQELTISRICRPLDKTLGLARLRNKSRPKTTPQRKQAVKSELQRRKRCAHRSSSGLEVAVLGGSLRSHVYDVVSVLPAQAK